MGVLARWTEPRGPCIFQGKPPRIPVSRPDRPVTSHLIPSLRPSSPSSIPPHPSVFATSQTPRKSITVLSHLQAKKIDSPAPGLVRYRLPSPRLSIRYQHLRPEPRELPACCPRRRRVASPNNNNNNVRHEEVTAGARSRISPKYVDVPGEENEIWQVSRQRTDKFRAGRPGTATKVNNH